MDIERWKKKKNKAQIEGNLDSVYFASRELAVLYYNHQKYDLAIQEYKEMEHMSEISRNQMDVGRANRMIGEVYCEKGDFKNAIKHQLKHLVISREEHDKVEEQRALATLGRTYFLEAESITDGSSGARDAVLDQSNKYYMESLAICHQLTDGDVGHKERMEMVARLFLNIGLVHDFQSNFESAIEHMEKAVSICTKYDLWEDLYRTYSALGGTYLKYQNRHLAIKTYDLALSVAERLSNKTQMMCEMLQLKAEALLELPDVRGARQALLKAYKLRSPDCMTRNEIERRLRIVAVMCECEEKLTQLSPEVDHAERKRLYEQMGDGAAELANFKMALAYYHLMLECVEKCGSEHKSLLECYISLAQTYKDDNQLSKSLEFLQKELELEEENSPEACKTLLNIAELYGLMGRRSEMYETYELAKVCSALCSDTRLKVTVLSTLHLELMEDSRINQADEVKREICRLKGDDPFEDSSSEEEAEPRREFGAGIDLDNLTDEEGGLERKDDRAKLTRTRSRRPVNIEKKNEKGETPLHVAAIQGNFPLASKLIEQGHRVDVKDFSGWTPLHEACNHGHTDVVKLLLEHGANVNDRGGPHCDGVTPLLDAASNGNLDIIELLLTHGASPLMRSNSGDSVLDCLSGWRRRRYSDVGEDLQGALLSQYSTLYNKLSKILENAGQRTSIKPAAESSTRLKARRSSESLTPSQTPIGLEKKLIESSKKPANEYENAMKALRFRTARCETAGEVAVPVRGLVNESDTVGDDWLEDDLELTRPQKKRKTGEFCRVQRRSRETVRALTPPSPLTLQDNFETEMTCFDGPSSPEADSIFKDKSIAQHPPSHPHDRQLESASKKRKQVLLTSIGVLKRRSAERELPAEECGEPSVPAQLSYSCVKVNIEGKLVVVPIPGHGEGLSIAWLASQAAHRYKSLEGVEPVVQLELEGGGLLIASDPLSAVLQTAAPLLQARVVSWNLSSPVSLYQEACQAFNASCVDEVKSCLEGCEVTGTVSVDDLYLKWTQLAPLIKALSHYQPLQFLSLASNNIADAHIVDVAECVSKLPHLKVLDLTNINITAKGLEKFSQCVAKNNGLKKLEELRLGHNPLGDSLRALSSLLDTAVHLRELSIPDVHLSSQPSFTSASLVRLGHNPLGDRLRALSSLLNTAVHLRELSIPDVHLSSQPSFTSASLVRLGHNPLGDSLRALSSLLDTAVHLRELSIPDVHLSSQPSFTSASLVRLGHNPLGDSLRALSSLLDTAVHLRELSIPDVHLSSQPSFTSASLDCIELLDVSYNEVGQEGLRELLGLLTPRVVKELRLAGSGPQTLREVGFYLEERAPPNLTLLDLSYCPYTSEDLHIFLRGCVMCEKLEKVFLDGVSAPEGALSELLSLPLKELSVCSGVRLPADLPRQMRRLVISTPQPQPSASYGLVIFAR